MLRSDKTTYVCDVNGFSFVKTSDKYYQDCALMLKKIIYKKLKLTWISNETEEFSKFFKANKERLEKNRTKALIYDDSKSMISS